MFMWRTDLYKWNSPLRSVFASYFQVFIKLKIRAGFDIDFWEKWCVISKCLLGDGILKTESDVTFCHDELGTFKTSLCWCVVK